MIPKLLLYLGAAMLVGVRGVRPLLGLSGPDLRSALVGLLLVFTGAVWLTASTLANLGFTGLGDWLDYLTTTVTGRASLLLLIGACLVVATDGLRLSWLAVLGAAGLLLWGLAGVGHGASHGSWVRALHVLHAGAMSLWLAGIYTIVIFQSRTDSSNATSGRGVLARRFTPIALSCLGTVVFTGSLMTLSHAGNLLTLPDSLYGGTLLIKLGLVMLALGMAVQVRRTFDHPGRLRLNLSRELLVLLAVVGVTALLSVTPPPTHDTSGGAGQHGSH